MKKLDEVRCLSRSGRFADALSLADATTFPRPERAQAEVLRIELLERTGQYSECRREIVAVVRRHRLSASLLSACELANGIIKWDAGATAESLVHLQKAISLAASAGDKSRLCWAQLRLFVILAGRSGSQSAVPLLAQARANATRLGEPLVTAALHIFVGEVEAKRGATESSERHTLLGQSLLAQSPNLWLESVAANNHVALALIRSDLELGIAHAEEAYRLATSSGAAAMIRACLGNLGNLHCAAGHFAVGTDYLERASNLLPSCGEYSNAPIDSLARTYYLMGDLQRAKGYLDVIEGSIRTPEDRALYSNRYAMLTRANVQAREGQLAEALDSIHHVLRLAKLVDDQLLSVVGRIAKAEVLNRTSETAEALLVLGEVVPTLPAAPPKRVCTVRAGHRFDPFEYWEPPSSHCSLRPLQADLRDLEQRG